MVRVSQCKYKSEDEAESEPEVESAVFFVGMGSREYVYKSV